MGGGHDDGSHIQIRVSREYRRHRDVTLRKKSDNERKCPPLTLPSKKTVFMSRFILHTLFGIVLHITMAPYCAYSQITPLIVFLILRE